MAVRTSSGGGGRVRILHVSDVYLPRLGGIERQVADLAAQQRRRGHDVRVLTSTAGDRAGDAADDAADDSPGTIRRGWASAAGAGRVVDEVRPDVVHCHTSLVSPLAWVAAREAVAAGVPTVVTMHSVAQQTWPLRSPLRAVARLVGPGAVWTAVSAVAAQALVNAVGRPVRVLPNGVDPGMWRQSAVGERDELTVVSVMRLAARKRPMALLEVLHEVHRQVGGTVPWRAVLAGSGPQQAAMERTVRRRGLQDVVSLVGRLDRPDVSSLLSAADLYVAPAVLESFGIAALEARCAGVPVVGFRDAGVQEFIQHGVHGELVTHDAAMAASIVGLLTDRDRLRTLGAGARGPVPHAWDAVLDRCEELYDLSARSTADTAVAVGDQRS